MYGNIQAYTLVASIFLGSLFHLCFRFENAQGWLRVTAGTMLGAVCAFIMAHNVPRFIENSIEWSVVIKAMALIPYGICLGITCRVEDVVQRKCLDEIYEQGGA